MKTYICEIKTRNIRDLLNKYNQINNDVRSLTIGLSIDYRYICFIFACKNIHELIQLLDDVEYDLMDINEIPKEEIIMIIEQIKDDNGNVTYEKHSDGYEEFNKYNDKGKLIYSRQQYPNGIIETEQFSDKEDE